MGCSYVLLLLSSIIVAVLGQCHHPFLQSSTDSTESQPYRTAYHFQPPKNWMNDPNGPMIYKGIYHLFYQYNPRSAVWGYIVWGHSTSTDLVNWNSHPPALLPLDPYDINGCWSGSATILQDGKPAILYTGIDSNNNQVQNLAVPKDPSDPYLVEWIKSPHNPIMEPNAVNKINSTLFRDPSTAWLGPDGRWRVIVGNGREHNGAALLYRSKDFVHWIEAEHPLHSSNETGMWECPDFFPVSNDIGEDGLDTSEINFPGVKHVLKTSVFRSLVECYTVGTYDHQKDIFIPDEGSVENESGLRLDYGKYYASKSFFDSDKNRRILLSWVNESTSSDIDIIKGWSGLQAFPRRIWLDKSGKQLIQWPVKEIEKLRTKQVKIPTTTLKAGSVLEVLGVTGAQADVEIFFSIPMLEKAEVLESSWTNPQELCSQRGASDNSGVGPFGLLVLASSDIQEFTAVFFIIFQHNNKFKVLICSDQKKSSLGLDYDKTTYGAFLDVDPVKQNISLRTLIDHSIVESFGGGGKTCITARVYPTLAINDNAHMFVFNNGSQHVEISNLSAWSLEQAQIN
ncbi:PREDICTED: beta-fructofuranosidase, insoluble isoenzyme CWINV3-like [Nicotiana attenuata]|uniref:Beta-fructofuranosidase, insoluble isoenzyme cwinv3 n=1 Tax=Nicotiana attenuata TaxID=49451 RepID=A0A314LCE0_NICAT|nr:PREDICTED: beta-fructofuranosidase, insoluble isoenzyme CWINV3-like [Nicotiana attenuata]XP_019261139.1 PREDICTED: beta-fructofuranosidase, insoluble isoenzyme CWINV3-like [Nicotiana attenuata]OIT38689.1 beta-fructofuranosidase, insoluble isoenzyme cwinv3 [Nicotiana attenuata]